MKKIIYIILSILFLQNNLNAQDTRFSIFHLAPYLANPALTGMHRFDMRLMANARNQWAPVLKSQAYNSYSFATDRRFLMENSYFGIGASFLGDKAGSSEFERNNAKLSLCYAKTMGKSSRQKYHTLIAGFEAGYSNVSLNVDGLRFLQQFNKSDIYDPSLPAPAFQSEYRSLGFGDIGAGLLWNTVMHKYYSFYIGASMNHINRPNVSFTDQKKMLPRYNLMFGGEYLLGDKNWALLPNVLGMKQGKSIELNSGVALRKRLSHEKSEAGYKAIQFGTWLRLNNKLESKILADALILFTRFDYHNYTIGFSYDTNISSLRLAHALNGSLEIAIHYGFNSNFKSNVRCPQWNKTQTVW